MKHRKSSVVLIFNDKGELAFQLRAAKDDSYPSHWDFSAAGGIKDGEDPMDAATREMQEEIGVEGDLKFIAEVLYTDERGEDCLYVYKTNYSGTFTPDPNEVDDEQFFTMSEIGQMIKTGSKFHPEFTFLWNKGLIQHN